MLSHLPAPPSPGRRMVDIIIVLLPDAIVLGLGLALFGPMVVTLARIFLARKRS
jgi:hypothetical protein